MGHRGAIYGAELEVKAAVPKSDHMNVWTYLAALENLFSKGLWWQMFCKISAVIE